MVTFQVESQAYETFSNLKASADNDSYTIMQMIVVKNEGGHIVPKDAYDSGINTADDTIAGGLLGAVVGVLGGPVGVVLGAGVGLLAGDLVDTSDSDDESSLLAYVSHSLLDGQTAIIALVQEESTDAFDLQFDGTNCVVMNWDAATIADEVEQADEIQQQLAKEAREKLRAKRKEDRHEAIEKKRAEIKQKFEDFKKQF